MNESSIALNEADEHLGDDTRAHRPETLAAPFHLGFLEDVLPERCGRIEAERGGDAAIRPRRDLRSRERCENPIFTAISAATSCPLGSPRRTPRRRLRKARSASRPGRKPGNRCSAGAMNGSSLRE